MRASKENCQDALAKFNTIILYGPSPEDVKFIREFLEAAEKKLPKESSFAKDMLRDAGSKK